MKKCSKCNTNKDNRFFSKNNSLEDGLYSFCKECDKEIQDKYRRTKIGLLKHIYSRQIQSSKKRNMNLPTYTSIEFVNKLKDDSLFIKIYDNWIKNKCIKKLIPSIDRIEDMVGYTFKNIQIMTWEENELKGHNDSKNKYNNRIHKCVAQYDKDGKYINSFFSIMDADRKTGISNKHISSVCKNSRKTTGGYIWRYIEYDKHIELCRKDKLLKKNKST